MKATFIALTCLALLPLSLRAQSESFVVTIGSDTIAVERFTLTANRLEGELVTRGAPVRWKYFGDVVNARIPVLTTAAYTGADTAAAQSARITLQQDSAIIEVTTAGNTTTQRIVSERGALPLLNLAFSFVEIALRGLDGDARSVPFFLVGVGQTMRGELRRAGRDSVVLMLSEIELALKIDARGRILRGAVPAQRVTIERSTGAAQLREARADYTAPPNASFTAEAVTIATPAGHTIAGTLTLPKAPAGAVPVVVTISGSGLQDRDETLAGVTGYAPFRQIAEALAARGVGVLRYDDRGFGASGGNAAAATTADFADDTRAVLAYLRARRDVDARKLFLLGHSEGAMIATAVAATDPGLRGILLLASPARSGRRIIEYQNRYAIDARTDLSATQRDSLYRVAVASLDSIAARQPWIRYFLDYDPLVAARKVKAPVVILHGRADRQITADQAAELAAAIRASGNSAVSLHVLPDVNHLFLRDPDGNPASYGSLPDKRWTSSVVTLITDWVVNQAK